MMENQKLSLLYQIQESVVQEKCDLCSILLKLRLLAARLGSDLLEEWVKYESEGYPNDIEVPSYRVVGLSYFGTFVGPSGIVIKNTPIPLMSIKKHAGERWINHKIRQSIAVLEDLIKSDEDGNSTIGINASNLIILLHGKVYPQLACTSVSASISCSEIIEIRHTVRNKILELTIEFEKKVPGAKDVTFGDAGQVKNTDKVPQISKQIIYGNVNTAIIGNNSNLTFSIIERDTTSLIEYLIKSGIPEADAIEVAGIMEKEEPTSAEEPFGEKAKKWLGENLKKATQGVWKIGISMATKILTEAALKYYGLK